MKFKKFGEIKPSLLVGIFLVLLGALSSTFAANLTLNQDDTIEFGRGKYDIKACQSWININLDSGYFESPVPGSYLNKIFIESLDTYACKGKSIKLKFFQTEDIEILNPYGGAPTEDTSEVACSPGEGSEAIVGARVYKTPGGYVAGVRPYCESIDLDGERQLANTFIGIETDNVEDILCESGDFAIGMYSRSGFIVDGFGIQCGSFAGEIITEIQTGGGGGGTTPLPCTNGKALFKLSSGSYGWDGTSSLTQLRGYCAGLNETTNSLRISTQTLNIYGNLVARNYVRLAINLDESISLIEDSGDQVNISDLTIEQNPETNVLTITILQPIALMSAVNKVGVESSGL